MSKEDDSKTSKEIVDENIDSKTRDNNENKKVIEQEVMSEEEERNLKTQVKPPKNVKPEEKQRLAITYRLDLPDSIRLNEKACLVVKTWTQQLWDLVLCGEEPPILPKQEITGLDSSLSLSVEKYLLCLLDAPMGDSGVKEYASLTKQKGKRVNINQWIDQEMKQDKANLLDNFNLTGLSALQWEMIPMVGHGNCGFYGLMYGLHQMKEIPGFSAHRESINWFREMCQNHITKHSKYYYNNPYCRTNRGESYDDDEEEAARSMDRFERSVGDIYRQDIAYDGFTEDDAFTEENWLDSGIVCPAVACMFRIQIVFLSAYVAFCYDAREADGCEEHKQNCLLIKAIEASEIVPEERTILLYHDGQHYDLIQARTKKGKKRSAPSGRGNRKKRK